jgi:hypothetical protein
MGSIAVCASPPFALDGQIQIHDPSTIVQCDGKFYTYGTGGSCLVSDDGWTWRRGVPPARRGMAPDIIHLGDRFCMYIVRGLAMNTLRNMSMKALIILAASALLALARPASAERAPDNNGFMQRWLILEPIPVNGLTDSAVQAAVRAEYFPGQFTIIPHDGDTVTVGGKILTWHAVDTNDYNVNLYYFAYRLGKPTSDVLFWAVTIVDCPREMLRVRLAIGSNAASVWWVNGSEVIGIYGDRQTVIDDGISKRLTLKKGQTIVRCAVVNGGGATDFCARFLDEDDKPLKGFTLNLRGPKQP